MAMDTSAQALQAAIPAMIERVAHTDGSMQASMYYEQLRAAGTDRMALLQLAGTLQGRLELIKAYEG